MCTFIISLCQTSTHCHSASPCVADLLRVKQTSGQTIQGLRRGSGSEIPHHKITGSHGTLRSTSVSFSFTIAFLGRVNRVESVYSYIGTLQTFKTIFLSVCICISLQREKKTHYEST